MGPRHGRRASNSCSCRHRRCRRPRLVPPSTCRVGVNTHQAVLPQTSLLPPTSKPAQDSPPTDTSQRPLPPRPPQRKPTARGRPDRPAAAHRPEAAGHFSRTGTRPRRAGPCYYCRRGSRRGSRRASFGRSLVPPRGVAGMPLAPPRRRPFPAACVCRRYSSHPPSWRRPIHVQKRDKTKKEKTRA